MAGGQKPSSPVRLAAILTADAEPPSRAQMRWARASGPPHASRRTQVSPPTHGNVGARAGFAPGVRGMTATRGLAALMDRYLDGDGRAFAQLHAALTPR